MWHAWSSQSSRDSHPRLGTACSTCFSLSRIWPAHCTLLAQAGYTLHAVQLPLWPDCAIPSMHSGICTECSLGHRPAGTSAGSGMLGEERKSMGPVQPHTMGNQTHMGHQTQGQHWGQIAGATVYLIPTPAFAFSTSSGITSVHLPGQKTAYSVHSFRLRCECMGERSLANQLVELATILHLHLPVSFWSQIKSPLMPVTCWHGWPLTPYSDA